MRGKIDFGMVFKLCLLFSISLIILTVLVGSNIISEFITSFLGEKSIEIDGKLLIEIIKIIISIIGACLVSQRYLNDRKNKVITESRIDWMYKIREYIIELNDCLNSYLLLDHVKNNELDNSTCSIDSEISMINLIDTIILYIAPEKEGRSELDKELESILNDIRENLLYVFLIKQNNSNYEYRAEKNYILKKKQKELLDCARIYFKIEWEKVKYEVKNDAQDLFDTDKYYERHYK